MNSTAKRIRRSLIGCGILFALAFGTVAQATALDTVKLAIGYIPNVQFTPLYVGIDKGFYRDAGIDLRIEYGFGIDIFSLLALGKIDLGLSDSDQLIISGSKGVGLKAVYQYYQSYPIAIVAKRPEITQPEQLVGKTIGTPELFGTSYIGLLLFLNHFGLTNRVKIEKIGYSQIPALLSGRVAAAVCFLTNETVKLKQMNVPITEWDVRDFSNMVGSSFISSDQFINGRQDVLRRFLEATRRATAYTIEHPNEAVSIAMRSTDATDSAERPFLAAALAATTSLFGSAGGYGHLDLATYTDSIRTLADLGLIPAPYPADRIVRPF